MALPRFLYSESTTQSQALLVPPSSATVNRTYEMAETVRSQETLDTEIEVNNNPQESSESNGVPRTLERKPQENGRGAFDYPVVLPGTSTLPSTLGRSAVTNYTDSGDYVFYKDDRNRTKWQEAALYVREGEDNDKFFHHPTGKYSKLAYTILHHPVFYVTDLVTCVLLMLLILIEKPETSVIPVMSDSEKRTLVIVHGLLELLFLSILAIDIVLRFIWLRPHHFFRHRRTVILTVLLIVMYIEAIVVLVRANNHVRITRTLRPFFFIDTHLMGGLRRVLRQVFQSIKPIVDVLLLLIFVVAIFSVFGYLLFAVADPTYFESFQKSYVSLFITLTTANNPDVMMQSYSKNGASALFFIFYLIITLYFISNVLLAVVYSSFSEEGRKKFRKLFLHKREALRHAYHVLVSSDGICFHDFLLFMQEYRPRMPEWQVMCIFKALHTNPNEQHTDLSVDEFYNFYEVRDLKWRQVTPEGEHLMWYNNFHHSIKPFFEAVYKLVTWRWFNTISYVIVLLNALFLVIYALTIPESKAGDRNEEMSKVLPISFVFISLYWLEIILKIVGFGPLDYFRKFWNSFDFIVILGSSIGLFLELDPSYHFLAAIRPIKLIRLLRLKRRYRDIINTLLVLTPRLISVGLLLVVIYYIFAIIGLEFFEGKVGPMCCNDSWYDVREFYQAFQNESSSNIFYLNNFDNALRSYVTLFILMVVNNWYIIMEGFASESRHEWLARIYFMAFYIITLVILQVVIAFIVEAFVFKITATDRQRQCQRHKRWNCDCIEDDQRKKEVVILLVDADMTKLKYEVVYRSEKEREKGFNFNRYWRNSKRIKMNENTVLCKYVGRRLRSRDDIHLLMYKSQLPQWIQELDQQLHQEQVDDQKKPTVAMTIWKYVKKVLEFILE